MMFIEPRALHIKSKCLASELYSVSGFSILKNIKSVKYTCKPNINDCVALGRVAR